MWGVRLELQKEMHSLSSKKTESRHSSHMISALLSPFYFYLPLAPAKAMSNSSLCLRPFFKRGLGIYVMIKHLDHPKVQQPQSRNAMNSEPRTQPEDNTIVKCHSFLPACLASRQGTSPIVSCILCCPLPVQKLEGKNGNQVIVKITQPEKKNKEKEKETFLKAKIDN